MANAHQPPRPRGDQPSRGVRSARGWRRFLGAAALALGTSSCATLQQLVALRHVDFSLDGVD